jgi:hypothetical protein
MSRYYFDIHDGEGLFVDEQGMDLVDMDAAIAEARRALADMVRDSLRGQGGSDLSILIRDGADGPVLMTCSLTMIHPDDRDA